MIELSAESFTLEYEKDAVKANAKYVGKTVSLSGEIFYVGESNIGIPMILFRPPESTFLQLGIYFGGESLVEKPTLVNGMHLSIEGVVLEKSFGSMIEVKANRIVGLTLNPKG